MKSLLILAGLLASTPSLASFYESCEFHGTVEDVVGAPSLGQTVSSYKQVITFKVESVADLGGHTACTGHIGLTKTLINETDQSLTPGQDLLVEYQHINGRSPDGYRFSETWTILDRVGTLAYRCFQLTRDLPTYGVELRRPTGPVRTDSLYFNAYVTRDSEVIDSQLESRVRFLSDLNGGTETIIQIGDSTLTTSEFFQAESFAGTLTTPDVEKAVRCVRN